MTLRLHPEAHDEARETAAYYERQRPGLGDELADILASALGEIEQHPRRFARMDDADPGREYRYCLLERFPYAVFFEVRPDEIIVMAVSHVRRKPGYWRRRQA